jgi:hypothetical protein
MKARVVLAKECLAKAAPIPGWPFFRMGMAATLGSESDLNLMQKAIDYLTCKAKAKMPFTDDEKSFLKSLFEDLWYGGEYKGYYEAAKLVNHYVNGNGEKIRINATVYQTSIIVKDTSEAIKDYIRQLILQKADFGIVRSSDLGFRQSQQFKRVSKAFSGRSVELQGHVLPDGNLLTEQSNKRLKNANNRFILVAQNSMIEAKAVSTRWRVDDKYEFDSFEQSNYITDLSLSASLVLKLPDGLSQYMVVLGIAKEFEYWAEWQETWDV